MRRTVTTAAATAAFAAVLTFSAPTAQAAPGKVCFWTGPDETGTAWCYSPSGYAEAGPGVARNVHSFSSHVDRTVYAISYGSGSGCLYREIPAFDFSDNWQWGGKLDGVSDTTMGCQPG
ncbi:hypothetical protein [Streptomyces sp. enrichment culture]|uniref:hypothetical protein n=1 Tax=Streptomyces sp. enrichment culture TaxID=1795815 RepID=UPI003F56A25A